ncbi:sulfatase-like hydrolase/transferase [Paenibacillus filicis]|uniref:Sulfatase-like hydrolase/transferase n=1 Tax=Paenibacillus filicis TaxID=669464 RepID=A0ABU9DJJ1_9BACL
MKTPRSSANPLEKPNFLVFVVDEERYPPVYEDEDIREWRQQNLITQQLLKTHAVEFQRHYIGSAACCPSRATLFTGHYPSLHGVTQTDGIAKHASDSDMFWLDPNAVPTMGDYFRAAGYQTYYKGKWHISHEDIVIPGTHTSLASYDALTGLPNEKQDLYRSANRLGSFGFSDWIGPEPHGKNPRNSGSSAAFGVSGRDEGYAEETVELLQALDRLHHDTGQEEPWLVVASFVNPHDIVLYGDLTAQLPVFRFDVGPMPEVPPPPTIHEDLLSKPRCQASYRDIYPQALQPITDQSKYRKLYYQLQKNADRQMHKVFEALTHSSFYDNTIVIFTSDHGDLLGAHGQLYQKMYCAYEEVIHVPFLIYNRQLFPQPVQANTLTSHVDLLPTMLGLANIDIAEVQSRLQGQFSEARRLVGRNLTPLLREQHPLSIAEEPIYFMTDDEITRGQHQISPLGHPYPAVIQPNHIETVITFLYRHGKKELWKLSRYFDNPQFWSTPCVEDTTYRPARDPDGKGTAWVEQSKTKPCPDEYELYHLTEDPLETRNLAHPAFAQQYPGILSRMLQVLEEQRRQKRLYPERSNR